MSLLDLVWVHVPVLGMMLARALMSGNISAESNHSNEALPRCKGETHQQASHFTFDYSRCLVCLVGYEIDLRYSDGRSNSLLNNATQRSVPQQHRFRSISFARLIVSYLRQHALCFRIPGRSLLAGRKRTRRSSVRGARQRTSNIYIY